MAQVDITRFVANVQKLFAPKILDGQEFIAYIDSNNSLYVQAENITHTSTAEGSIAQFEEFKSFCNSLPAVQTQIQTLSGSTNGEGAIDFNYSDIFNEIVSLKQNVEDTLMYVQDVNNLRAEVDYLNANFDKMQQIIEDLATEIHSLPVSSSEYDLSE